MESRTYVSFTAVVYEIVSILQRYDFCTSFISICNLVLRLFADIAKMSSREFYLARAPRTVHLKSSHYCSRGHHFLYENEL